MASSAPSKSETTRTSQSWVTIRAASVERGVEAAGGVGDDGGLGGEGEVAVGDEVEQAQHRGARAAGGDGGGSGVGEDEAADAVALAEDAPGGERGDLGGGDRLHVEDGAEEHRLALVDEDERRAVAFLAGDADVRRAGAGGDLPVDGADVVAGQVGAELLELEAAAAQAAGAAAGEGAADRLARQEVEAARPRLEPGEVAEVGVDARVRARHGSGGGDELQQVGEDRVGVAALALGLVGERDAVAEDVGGDGLDVAGGDEVRALEPGVGAGAAVEREAGARAGAELDLAARGPRSTSSGWRVALTRSTM